MSVVPKINSKFYLKHFHLTEIIKGFTIFFLTAVQKNRYIVHEFWPIMKRSWEDHCFSTTGTASFEFEVLWYTWASRRGASGDSWPDKNDMFFFTFLRKIVSFLFMSKKYVYALTGDPLEKKFGCPWMNICQGFKMVLNLVSSYNSDLSFKICPVQEIFFLKIRRPRRRPFGLGCCCCCCCCCCCSFPWVCKWSRRRNILLKFKIRNTFLLVKIHEPNLAKTVALFMADPVILLLFFITVPAA